MRVCVCFVCVCVYVCVFVFVVHTVRVNVGEEGDRSSDASGLFNSSHWVCRSIRHLGVGVLSQVLDI